MTPEPLPLDSPLLALEEEGTLTLTPHMAGAGIEARLGMLAIAVANIIAALSDQPLPMELKLDSDWHEKVHLSDRKHYWPVGNDFVSLNFVGK